MLGVGYAILAFSGGNIIGWWIYTFMDGTAWGVFVMIFIFTIWGDLAEGRNSEKIYAIGLMPYLLSTLIRYSFGAYLTIDFATKNFAAIFSFFSFFLFIAVFPLVFAPETLPEQVIKDNDLQSYIKKAQKQVSKIHPKNSSTKGEQSPSDPEQKGQDEYEKARELAEKYY
jgi:Sec-independent protein translocase protein TatA